MLKVRVQGTPEEIEWFRKEIAKTFTSSSVAAAIVRAGRKVLAIDNDPQVHCSRCLGVRKLSKDTPTIYTIMKKVINGEFLEEREGIILSW